MPEPQEPHLKPGDEAAPGTPGAGEDICATCGGTGKLPSGAECPECEGTGKVMRGIGGG
jgi:RecJ-like exonuclease